MTNPSRANVTKGGPHGPPQSSRKTIRYRQERVKSMTESFGDRLRRIRESKGLNQGELAERTGLQPSAVSHFESGRRSPSFENLNRLADALSVSLDFLIGRMVEARPAGPMAQQLFRHFEQMSVEDQENLAKFAEMLARKHRDRQRGK